MSWKIFHQPKHQEIRPQGPTSQNSSKPMDPEPSASKARKKRFSSVWRTKEVIGG